MCSTINKTGVIHIYLTSDGKLIQYYSIHDTIQYLNSKCKPKPLSEVGVRMKLRSVMIKYAVHSK